MNYQVGVQIPFTELEIIRTCPAQLLTRRSKLESTWPTPVGQTFRKEVTTAARRIWIEEAKVEGHCADGALVQFFWGPMGTSPPPGESGGMVLTGFFDSYFSQAWRELPFGTQETPPK